MNLYDLLQRRKREEKPIRVGVIGAGKFATMFFSQALLTPGIKIVGIADLYPEKARKACIRAGWPESKLSFQSGAGRINEDARAGKTVITDDALALIEAETEIILEVTGIPEAGAMHAVRAMENGKDVVMVNVEADALLGPWLRKKADALGRIVSMAYGDQPAIICEQIDWARAIGLEVVCAGKGTRYQPAYHDSTPDTVWKFYGFSDEQVKSGDYNAKMFNSFLDGTKSAIEMCAVANGSGLTPQKEGLQFPPVGADRLQDFLKPRNAGGILGESGTVEVVASENRDGTPVENDLRWGTYVVFRAPTEYVRRCFIEYGLKADESGYYSALYRPYHLIGLELGISVASVALRREPTGSSRIFAGDVAAVAKKDLKSGDILDGEGGHTVFGRLARAEESILSGFLPMGLTDRAKVTAPVSKGSVLTYKDVELDESAFAFRLRKSMEREMRPLRRFNG
ncbi:MAG: flagellar biosynthesis protein FlgA [Desulfobacteraceae bacterium]|nr:MAG: flagellar biosynthesis protein FlgA [Desulfobacteraceae bacterium]